MSNPVPIDVSVVCPFFNEQRILEEAVGRLLARMEHLEASWEVILVDDGSTDGSAAIVRELCREHPRLHLVSYPVNRGRGHALRQGMAWARGDVIVTTEADLSWGEDIVERLYAAMQADPSCDMIIASPNLPGGGYRNVPLKRVLVSRLGNRVIRAAISGAATMNTGMTRAYRRSMIRALPLEEDGKEFHLEVILKAHALGYRFREIPCVLAWREYRSGGRRVERKSSSRVNRLIVTHTLFSLFANPIRYVWPLSALTLGVAFVFLVLGLVFWFRGQVAIYSLVVGLSLAIISLVFFTLGVIAHQGHAIQRELWSLRRERALERASSQPTADTKRPRRQGSTGEDDGEPSAGASVG